MLTAKHWQRSSSTGCVEPSALPPSKHPALAINRDAPGDWTGRQSLSPKRFARLDVESRDTVSLFRRCLGVGKLTVGACHNNGVLGKRYGDASEMVILELVGASTAPDGQAETAAAAAKRLYLSFMCFRSSLDLRLPHHGAAFAAQRLVIQRTTAVGQPAHNHLVTAYHLLAINAEVLPFFIRAFGDD